MDFLIYGYHFIQCQTGPFSYVYTLFRKMMHQPREFDIQGVPALSKPNMPNKTP